VLCNGGMTLHATREGENVTIHCTYGPVTFQVSEHEGHVAHFWWQLGKLLAEDPAHREAHAEAAYMRYCAHAGGKSVHGEDLPLWGDAPEEVREHWRAAVSG
jgi:hypothetical protein